MYDVYAHRTLLYVIRRRQRQWFIGRGVGGGWKSSIINGGKKDNMTMERKNIYTCVRAPVVCDIHARYIRIRMLERTHTHTHGCPL